MRIEIFNDSTEIGKRGAEIIQDHLNNKSDCVLGLATGSSPKSVYSELIKMKRKGDIDFYETKIFSLDEYCGLNENHPQSFAHYLRENFLNYIDIKSEHIHFLSGINNDWELESIRYEKLIEKAGGIDIQLLGIGENGHIGFNEPDVSFSRKTQVVTLSQKTKQANQRFFAENERVPEQAITMGVSTIMHAKHIVMIAMGKDKAEAVARMIEGPIIPGFPASVLQMHQNVTVLLDNDAAYLLKKEEENNI